ncbi:hypothetical protein FSP39_020244 [Pinctada imbricata]|uniref:Major facilitator superfamily (MFS) profile domain-containing protein n=1 Tax=Pinctada imbricata TaxID=66713 RepID=A0AA88YF00_PINIB|nr:hypothetical protein FSP39_020244 [Pinctada imbricata]
MADNEDGTTGQDQGVDRSEGSDRGFRSQGCCCYFPKRYLITLLTGFGMLLVYSMRTNVGIAAITILDLQAHTKVGTERAKWGLPTVEWTTRMIGFLHSVFYIGFFLSHIPAGYLTTVWPCHRIYGGSILLSASLNLLIPISIEELGYITTCAVRFLQGITEGFLYPSCYGLLRHWSTTTERGRLLSGVLSGSYMGAIIGFPLAGFITHYISWQYVFYASGGSCILWYMLWMFIVYEKPGHHPCINEDELNFITKAQGSECIEYENLQVPWKQILTSLPVIALCVCHFTRFWVFILMLTNEPYYLNMFGFSIAENGLYSSIPHIVKVLFAFTSGYIADFFLSSTRCTTTIVRKCLTCGGFGVQALCFYVLTLIYDGTTVLIVLSLGIGFFGLTVSGWQINHYDLSVRYAGLLVSITSAFGCLGAVAAPLVAGEFLHGKDLLGWDYVFYTTSGLLVFTTIFYLIFGSGEEQPWANPPAGVKLVQKVDPLVRAPYKIYKQQKPNNNLDKVYAHHRPSLDLDDGPDKARDETIIGKSADNETQHRIQPPEDQNNRVVQRMVQKIESFDKS